MDAKLIVFQGKAVNTIMTATYWEIGRRIVCMSNLGKIRQITVNR